jgi:exosome complex exonuclease RRP6
MAALLHAFPSTPPVVRRRSKELLDVIRDAVKRALSGSVEGQATPLVTETSGTAVVPSQSDGDDLPVQTPPASQSPSFWSRNKVLPTETTSSLFGASVLSSRPHLSYSATTSSLFGSVHPSEMSKVNTLSRFQDVVKKIHSTLVITPTVPAVRASCRSPLITSFIIGPQVPPTEVTTTSVEVAVGSIADTAGDGAMTEIPFVPASRRQPVKAEVVDDAIVVVGQRQKKRKRNKNAGIGREGSHETTPSTPADAHAKVEPEEILPFDFASVPNILDDAPGERSELEDGRTGKRRRSKKGLGEFCLFLISFPLRCNAGLMLATCLCDVMTGAALDRDSFPATPKDRREVRSGNVTRSFRS